MTTLTDTQVITASGGLVELGYSQITSSVTVGTSVTNVTSTLTVVCDGGPILVEFFAPSARCFAGGDNLTFSLFEDGVQKASPWGESVSSNDLQATPVQLQYRLTPSAGSHTYQVKAISSLSSSQQVRAGSGGTGSPAYSPAFLRVSKIVQATQWPAVTTGTIICTSSTRPASPFEGQTVYETDTKKEMTYTGAAWTESRLFRTANGSVVDNYRVPPSCAVRTTTQRNFSAGGYVTFDTDSGNGCHDTDDMWASGDPTKIIIKTAGIYIVSFWCWMTSVTAGAVDPGQAAITATIGGSNVEVAINSASGVNNGTGAQMAGSAAVALSANDYIRLGPTYTGGGSQTNLKIEVGTRLQATWVGQSS